MVVDNGLGLGLRFFFDDLAETQIVRSDVFLPIRRHSLTQPGYLYANLLNACYSPPGPWSDDIEAETGRPNARPSLLSNFH